MCIFDWAYFLGLEHSGLAWLDSILNNRNLATSHDAAGLEMSEHASLNSNIRLFTPAPTIHISNPGDRFQATQPLP